MGIATLALTNSKTWVKSTPVSLHFLIWCGRILRVHWQVICEVVYILEIRIALAMCQTTFKVFKNNLFSPPKPPSEASTVIIWHTAGRYSRNLCVFLLGFPSSPPSPATWPSSYLALLSCQLDSFKRISIRKPQLWVWKYPRPCERKIFMYKAMVILDWENINFPRKMEGRKSARRTTTWQWW